MQLSNFNVDLKNSVATLTFNWPLPPGVIGLLPWVNVAVKVSDADSKTGKQLKQEAAAGAIKMMEEVIAQLKGSEFDGQH